MLIFIFQESYCVVKVVYFFILFFILSLVHALVELLRGLFPLETHKSFVVLVISLINVILSDSCHFYINDRNRVISPFLMFVKL